MRLKRVRIFGFKTFADRTEFDVSGGVIAVVGPNGCGKSNLVDAILWGLGEGNSRQLRAQTSQDVIFSGSSKRKPVGFAEVTLLFDNEDGALPIESAEVAISRRLTRAGESEYSINRQSCRLRDVLDLLTDSGLGRAGYSIVGQKEIDSALAASAEDRRSWIDEAAGVQRYRGRKQDSARRLIQAQNHLERVADIVAEIETQREPLKEEAEVARRYRSIMQSLREVESNLLVVEIAKASHEVTALEAKVSNSQRLADTENLLAESLDRQAGETALEVRRLDASLDELRAKLSEALMKVERADGAIKLCEQKLANLDDLEKNLDHEGGQGSERLTEAQREIESTSAEFREEEKALDELRTLLSGAGEQAEKLRKELAELDAQLTKARDQHTQRLKLEAESAHRAERQKSIRRELKGIVESLPDLVKGLAEVEADLSAKEASVKESEAQRHKFLSDIEALRKAETAEEAERRELLVRLGSLEGRRQGLEATIAEHEGLNQGAKAVLEMAKAGLLPNNYWPVGEVISVESDLALAIETALGGAINDLIVPQESDAKTAISLLRENRLGRATFQPIPLMRPQEPNNEFRRVEGERGVIGRASELIECDNRYRPVLDSLLGRVLIIESLDTALKLAKTQGWHRLVTVEGELITSGGAVTGGQGSKQPYGVVQRRADLKELEREGHGIQKRLATFDAADEKRKLHREKLEEELSKWADGHRELESELTESRKWRNQVADEVQGTERAKQKLEQELQALQPDLLGQIAEVNIPQIEAKRDELLKVLAARSADSDSAKERLRESETRLSQAQLRMILAQKRLAAAVEHEVMRAKRIANLQPERDKVLRELESAQKHLADAEVDRDEAAVGVERAGEKRTQLQESQGELLDKARLARQNANKSLEESHQAELGRARAEARKANSVQRLLEEYSISEEDALALAPGVEVLSDAATMVGRLRRELRSMGEVNLGAIEAYERLTTRYDELTTQREDILASIEQVNASIRELDKLTREKFITTFEAVQEAFAALFQQLFGGGEGALRLANTENLLDSGIDIDVQLPGKKKQRLELLSGGERSLCATAFLFALLKVKPSPLVVLDEVDAPLDGRNVERFVSMLHDFSKLSQFIVITHNPATIESAPVWLGVTMSEPGVSSLVPSRIAAVQKEDANVEALVL
ncbi:MAG: chromosome segregation protein SMC [Fimbriimonadaceae bacterium]